MPHKYDCWQPVRNLKEKNQRSEKRSNNRTVQEQMEVAPRSCRTSPALHAVWQHCGRKWAWMRYARSKTSLLVQTYSFSSGDPRIKRKSCGRGTPKNDTGTLTPHQCNASRKGKCFSSFTCRNYLRSHSAHGLEVAKESNLPFGQGCPSLQERRLDWRPM